MAIRKIGAGNSSSDSNSSPTCFVNVSVTSTTGTLNYSPAPVAVWVGTAGNLKVVGKDGVTAILPVVVGQNNIAPSAIVGDADTTARGVTLAFHHEEV